jgi:PHP family Zn ribbon phosphoesterase
MSTLVITTKSVKHKELYNLLSKQLGDEMKVLSETDKEDLALGNAMDEGRTGKFVSTKSVLKKLRAK